MLADRRNLIHRAIKAILAQVPTGRSVLFPILSEFFPHKRFSRNVQTEYTSQLLQMCKYEPMLQARILELIVAKCLEMDVEIVIEESGEVRIDGGQAGQRAGAAGTVLRGANQPHGRQRRPSSS